ncbi:ExeA family protein [Jannaschia sp. 2305UL9-9]|uniref:ExeA family protein n=1 Tax=Jannaschia sp. 2305UL9-9 TaxID=3121638 RepID=UPI003527B1CC
MTRSPITLLTGDVGAGKTTLLHHLLDSLETDVIVGMVANAQGDRDAILRWVMLSLDQPSDPRETYVDLFSRFQSFLIDRYAQGQRVVLIFDEAQALSHDALEELRMLTNINSGKDDLVQVILVGQPELRDIVHAPELTQFVQRIGASFHLRAMDATTVAEYIKHRLAVAGAEGEIFSKQAMQLVYDATGGVPRLVNKLCDVAMVYTYSSDRLRVEERTIQQVLEDGLLIGGPASAANNDQLLLDKTWRV